MEIARYQVKKGKKDGKGRKERESENEREKQRTTSQAEK